MVEKLQKSMFSENLNSKFIVRPEGGDPIETELIEFKEVNTSPKQEQFSLLFRGPLDIFLKQGMYKVEHEKIGAFELFLVPVRKDQEGFCYEAVFNRLINNV